MDRRELLRISAAVAAAAPGLAQVSAAWRPQLFDAHQNETVIALSELIIPATDTPGAKAAFVNRYLDKILSDGPEPEREGFLEGLASLDGDAIKAHGAPFVKLTVEQQTAALKKLDRGQNPFFRMAKQYTSRIYYATEIGFKELNKDGRVPAKYGCDHTDHTL